MEEVARTRDENSIEEVVLDKEFWKSIVIYSKGTFFIIEVLRMVGSDDELAISFMYKAMDWTKEKIQKEFKDDNKR